MKRILVSVFFMVLMNSMVHIVYASPVDSLGIKTENGKKYILHRVEQHEGWFGIAHKYGISYNDIRIANKNLSDTIHIGQVVLIPVDKVKAIDPENKKNDAKRTDREKQTPVYHKVRLKETLFAIAKKYKATKDDLKKWNHLTSGNLKTGDSLIVGYKKIKIGWEQTKAVKQPSIKLARKETAERTSSMIEHEKKKGMKPDSSFVTKANPELKEVESPSELSNPEFAPNRKEMNEQGVATWIEDENINPDKYFALHRIAPVGTIVKVTNRMNKRTVFVKVVGKLPDTGDNDNIIIKISKASAQKLGVHDQRFQCDLAYGVSEK